MKIWFYKKIKCDPLNTLTPLCYKTSQVLEFINEQKLDVEHWNPQNIRGIPAGPEEHMGTVGISPNQLLQKSTVSLENTLHLKTIFCQSVH